MPACNKSQCACSIDLRIVSFPLRAKLMIVVSETADRKDRKETQHIRDNLQKYCSRHGYLFKYHTLTINERVGIMGSRWLQLLDYWHVADWLLHIDSDTVVSNLTNSLDTFLDLPEHVLLHMRPNREVTAAAVAFRTTEFSRCFIERWLSVYESQRLTKKEVNGDNGALLLLIAEFLDPAVAKECSKVCCNPFHLITCFEKVHARLTTAHHTLPIRIFAPFAGFWRQHEGVHAQEPVFHLCRTRLDKTVRSMIYFRCWSNDVLVSGWKQMGEICGQICHLIAMSPSALSILLMTS